MKISKFIVFCNLVWITVIMCVLLGSLYIQFFIGEQPCRLCTWQRMAMFIIVTLLLMNIKFGQRASHYGIIIIFSLFGASVSVRQILSYIMPGNPGFGPVVFGVHTYTWAFLVFMSCILASSLMLVMGAQKNQEETIVLSRYKKGFFGLAVGACLCFSVATLFQCGLKVCPAATEFNVTAQKVLSAEEACCPADKNK